MFFILFVRVYAQVFINLFNFFRHYKSDPMRTVIRIHLISLSSHLLAVPSHFISMEHMLMSSLVIITIIIIKYILTTLQSLTDPVPSLNEWEQVVHRQTDVAANSSEGKSVHLYNDSRHVPIAGWMPPCTFQVASPRVWNSLPADITSAPSLSTFRKRLKTYLFRQSFPRLAV